MEKQEILEKIYIEIRSFEKKLSRIEDKLEREEKLDEFLNEKENEILVLFEKDSDEYRLWENVVEKRTLWKKVRSPGEKLPLATEGQRQEILKKIRALQRILERIGMVKIEDEIVFSAQEQYLAKRHLIKLFKSAGKKLTVIDEYLDETIFDFLDVIKDNIEVKLLTGGNKKSIFTNLFHAYKDRKGDQISSKIASWKKSSHSRYIMIDDGRWYSLGASINSVDGDTMKSFSITQIRNEQVISDLQKEFNEWWDNASQV